MSNAVPSQMKHLSKLILFALTSPALFGQELTLRSDHEALELINLKSFEQITSIELRNRSKKPIRAFRARLQKINDFGETATVHEIVFTSDSAFLDREHWRSNYLLPPEERFFFQHDGRPSFEAPIREFFSNWSPFSPGLSLAETHLGPLRGEYELHVTDLVFGEFDEPHRPNRGSRDLEANHSDQEPTSVLRNRFGFNEKVPLESQFGDSVETGGFEITNVEEDDLLNVRAAPSAQSSIVIGLRNGHEVSVVGDSKLNGETEWIPISFKGEIGWINLEYLRMKTPKGE